MNSRELAGILRGVPTTGDRRQQVGQWIKERREELGITAAQLARALDVDAKTITNAENGTHQPRFLARWEVLLRWRRGTLVRAAARQRGVDATGTIAVDSKRPPPPSEEGGGRPR